MLNKKISRLTLLDSVDVDTANDILAIVDTSADQTKKITVESILELMPGGPGLDIGTTSIASGTTGRIIPTIWSHN